MLIQVRFLASLAFAHTLLPRRPQALGQAQFCGSFPVDMINLTTILISFVSGPAAARIQICLKSKKWCVHQDGVPLTQRLLGAVLC